MVFSGNKEKIKAAAHAKEEKGRAGNSGRVCLARVKSQIEAIHHLGDPQ